MKVLVVRPDRLGDVVLSTPVFEAIKQKYPTAHITAMVRDGVAPLIEGQPFVDDLCIFDPERVHQGWEGFWKLVRELRRREFDWAVCLQSNRRVAAAIYLARVPFRVGPWSKIHSFLFYNRGMVQHRSRVEKHEADYNLELLRRMEIEIASRALPVRVALKDAVKEEAGVWLLQNGYDPRQSLVVVNPGMGGSALNWPEAYYLELLKKLKADGRQILVTGGRVEAELLERLRTGLWTQSDPMAVMFYGGAEARGLDFLAGLFSFAKVVVAPSTGPLHVAVALGKEVVAFYPLIRVQSAKRWGPYVADARVATVLTPAVDCEEGFKCAEELCKSHPCMRHISVQETFEAVTRRLGTSGQKDL